jgi:hypothetical protein
VGLVPHRGSPTWGSVPQDVVVERWYRIPDSLQIVSCVSAAFTEYQ